MWFLLSSHLSEANHVVNNICSCIWKVTNQSKVSVFSVMG